MTKPFFKLHAAAFAALLCATGAASAKTWVLSSDKSGLSTYVAGHNIVNSIYNTFEAASGGAGEIVDGRGLLHTSANAALPAVPAGVDVVVVATVQPETPPPPQTPLHGVNTARFAEVMNLVKTRPDLTFVFLNDGCCRRPDNTAVASALNDALGLTGPNAIASTGSSGSLGKSFFLNTNSPYENSFSSQPSLNGEVYGRYTNVPAPYAIYLAGNATNTPPAMPAATDKVEAYGLVIPRAATNGGACVIAFGDTSQFMLDRPAQPEQLAKNIMHAAKQADGACQNLTVATVDLKPTVDLPAALLVGGTATAKITVANQGLTPSTGGKLEILLPNNVELAGPLPAGCTLAAPLQVDCTLNAMAAGANVEFTLPIKAKANGALVFSAEIVGATGELAPLQRNNSTTTTQPVVPEPTAMVAGPATATAAAATTVTGSTANLADGTVIDVTVNGATVQATVNGGQFSASFPNGFPVGMYPVTITGPGPLKMTAPYTIDVQAAPATATINGPANAIANEAATVTGTTAHVPDGTVIDVTVNGTTVQATVNGGQFSASFPNGFPVGTHAVTITGPGGQNLPLTAPHSINVTARMPGNVTAVPTLDIWGLGALAALLGAMGLRQRRRSAR
ncbi:IPTL-CTERM sorting domain-containing protein [Comamonadaceae bacterium OH2545_COT-014]|nr:IPTL-CTERM sorting domain-containing protein [Comamonadaceae bacterium OH2545_COT-014]